MKPPNDYVDEAGRLLYQVVRKHGKRFVQRRPDLAGGWIWNLKGTSPIPYRLPEVIAAKFVAVVEGEKDANNLHRIGITATTTAARESSAQGWRSGSPENTSRFSRILMRRDASTL